MLCVAVWLLVAVAWGLSDSQYASFLRWNFGGGRTISSHDGLLELDWHFPPQPGLLPLKTSVPVPPNALLAPRSFGSVREDHPRLWEMITTRHGVAWGPNTTSEYRGLAVRYVFLTAIWGVPALIAIGMAWRKTRVPREGHCALCGYDLRATPGRCPECGALPSA